MIKRFVSSSSGLVRVTIFFVLCLNGAVAQDLEKISLTVSGQGPNKNQAVQIALRDAVESTFGAFVSSNTQILSDELVKDEIVSVSNGNIEKYEILTETALPDGAYSVTLKTEISLSKLKNFTKNKGFEVEFDGAGFAMNIKLQKFNEEQEYKTILNMVEVLEKVLYTSFDYTIAASEPTLFQQDKGTWKIPLKVGAKPNSNFKNFQEYLFKTLKGVSLSQQGKEDYVRLNKPVYTVFFLNNQKQSYQGDFVQAFESRDRKYMEFHLGGVEIAGLQYNGNNTGLSYRNYKKNRKREKLLASETKQEKKEREKREKNEVQQPITYGQIIDEIANDSDEVIKSFFDFDLIFLRKENSFIALKNLIHTCAFALQNFEVSDGYKNMAIGSFKKSYIQNGKLTSFDSFLVDDWFRVVFSKRNKYQNKATPLSLQNDYNVRIKLSNERDETLRINTVAASKLMELKYIEERNRYTGDNPYSEAISKNTQEMDYLAGNLALNLKINRYSLVNNITDYTEIDRVLKEMKNKAFPFWPLFGIYTLTSRDYFESIKELFASKNNSLASQLVQRDYLDNFEVYNPMLSEIMFLSFLNYTNRDGYSSIYYLEDYKTLQELEKVKGYTVSPVKKF